MVANFGSTIAPTFSGLAGCGEKCLNSCTSCADASAALLRFWPHHSARPPLPSYFRQLIKPIFLIGFKLSSVSSGLT
jgi:hypothetical protein